MTRHEKIVLSLLSLFFVLGVGIRYWQKSHEKVDFRVESLPAPIAANLAQVVSSSGIADSQSSPHTSSAAMLSLAQNSSLRSSRKRKKTVQKNHSVSHSSTPPKVVNLNSATLQELEELPHIGPVTAQKIIDWRQAHGSFRNKEDLLEVSGIGLKTFEQLRSFITVDQ